MTVLLWTSRGRQYWWSMDYYSSVDEFKDHLDKVDSITLGLTNILASDVNRIQFYCWGVCED